MASRSQLVEGWRVVLAENQRLLTEGSPRRRWIRQIYVQLYRFLVSCYGGEDWQADAEREGTGEGQPSRMEFVDHTLGEKGTQPRSAERIRATLDAVHAACDTPWPRGTLSGGLRDTDWIAVASESSLVSPRRLVLLLRVNGLTARQVRRGDDVIVEVHAAQREEAMGVLERNRTWLRISRRDRSRWHSIDRCIGNACFGAFVGAVVGAVPMMLLTGIIDAVQSSTPSPIGRTVLAIGWGCFVLGGAIVAVWRHLRKGL
jgi:hypothetical protein